MTRRLKNIKTKELSFVKKAANKRTFLFFKSRNGTLLKGSKMNIKKTKLSIAIESDGTTAGTTVKLNGDDMGKLRDFNFSFYGEDKDNLVNCSYSKVVESDDGFSRTETFYLSKGDKMDTEMLELLKDYLGDTFKEEHFEKAETSGDDTTASVKSALKILKNYKEDFPEDLEKAVTVVTQEAARRCGYPVQKSDDSKPDASDKKPDSDTDAASKNVAMRKQIVEAVQKALLPEEKKSDASSGDSELKTQLAEISKAVQSLKKDDNKDDPKVTEVIGAVEKLTKRLETVEKSRGMKKGVEGQDSADGDNDDGKKLWPSFSVDKK